MYKIIDSSFFDPEEPQVTIIDLSRVQGLTKAAVDSRVSEYVKNISPVPGKMYLHINAMGAGEYFGSNKNGDYFPEKNLIEYYKTFETNPAHVFRHHVNKDPAKSIGKVLFAVYNQRMHRVELITEVDKSLGSDIEAKISSGQYPSTSMACKTPYDECSVCGNRAKSRQEYCVHLKTQLNHQLADGRKVMALNIGPLSFFDISIVIRPADITSSILEKVASYHGYSVPIISSVEKAERLGFKDETIKEASIRKLSELTKRVQDSGDVLNGYDEYLRPYIDKVQDLPEEIIDHLSGYDFQDVVHGLAFSGISPSLTTLGEILARNLYKEDGVGMGEVIGAHAKNSLLNDNVDTDNFFDIDGVEKQASVNLIKISLNGYKDRCSILPYYIEKRANVSFHAKPPVYNIGTDREVLFPSEGENLLEKALVQPVVNSVASIRDAMNKSHVYRYPISVIKTLGDIILAAKIYINNLIQSKNDAKILIEKTAEAIFVKEICSPSKPPRMKRTDVTPHTSSLSPHHTHSNTTAKIIIKAIQSANANTVRSPELAKALRVAKMTLKVDSLLKE